MRLSQVCPVTSCANRVSPRMPTTTSTTEIGTSTEPIRYGVRKAPTAASSTAPQHATTRPPALTRISEPGSVGGSSSVTRYRGPRTGRSPSRSGRCPVRECPPRARKYSTPRNSLPNPSDQREQPRVGRDLGGVSPYRGHLGVGEFLRLDAGGDPLVRYGERKLIDVGDSGEWVVATLGEPLEPLLHHAAWIRGPVHLRRSEALISRRARRHASTLGGS